MRILFVLLLWAGSIVAAPQITKKPIFESGVGGYAMYRIPGLVVTSNGTILAYCEARQSSGSDWGQIDLVYRRSTDGGKSWEAMRPLVQMNEKFEKNPAALKQKLGKETEITLNNPVMIVDGPTVHLLFCVEYMRCFYSRSTDDGKTFTKPFEITRTFEAYRKAYDWKVIATGPGHGIRLSKSGRLIVPVWLSTSEGGHAHRPSIVSTIYSDDGGKTWLAGAIAADRTPLTNPNETAAIERNDGQVLLNIRHESATKHRAMTTSPDGASQWSKIAFATDLMEPVCQGSMCRIDAKRIAFTNPHATERRNVTIHLSDDDGQTWSQRRAIESGASGYADIAAGTNGQFYCLYERGGAGASVSKIQALMFATFNLEWLNQKPIRIVAFGDSITKGFRPGVDEVDAFPAQVEQTLNQAGLPVEVLNIGIGGENTAQAKARLKNVLAQQPQIVTIMYGANDSYIDKGKTEPRIRIADYRANLLYIVQELKKQQIKPILMTTNRYDAKHPVDGSGQHPNRMMDQYMATCREVATAEDVLLIDHQQRWIDAEKRGTDIEGWMTDHVHPNKKGHQEIANEILRVLKPLLNEK